MTKSESAQNEPIQKTTKSKLRKFQKLKRKLLTKLRKISENNIQNSNPEKSPEIQLDKLKERSEVSPKMEEKLLDLNAKVNIEKLLMDKLRKPQGNHLLHKLVSHVADRWSEEKFVNIENSQITAKMIKDSLHGEIVNFGRKNNFSNEEDSIILRMIEKLGKNWKEIAIALKNKTPNMVKNRYYTYLKKKFDQKYNDMISMSTTDSSIKIEEEKTFFKAYQDNSRKKAEMDHESKMKMLAELFRVNQILDLEKKKILTNILKLHQSIAKDKERKNVTYDRNYSIQNFQKTFYDFAMKNNQRMNAANYPEEVRKLVIQDQGNLSSANTNANPMNLQIQNLENVIKDALKQLHGLKNICGGL